MPFRKWIAIIVEIILRIGWLPIIVFIIHRIGADYFGVYMRWPWLDIPMHFIGGFAIAFFFSGAICLLVRHAVIAEPCHTVQLSLVFTLTCTAAVFWEFAEWLADHTIGSNYQVSQDDTMGDMFMGVVGGAFFLMTRFLKQRK
jgi:hypothetical protein